MAEDMNAAEGDPLDQLLRGWADRHTADAQSLDRIQGAIRQAMEQHREPPLAESTTTAAPGRRQWHALPYRIAAVAALLLAIVSVMVLPLLWPKRIELSQPHATQGGDAVPAAAITPQQLARDTQLFAELDRMFGRQLRWVAQSEGNVELGIESNVEAAAPSAHSKPVTIRLTVARRDRSAAEWSVVWTVTVVARNEQLVRLRPAQADAPSLMVWAYTLPDGKIACDAELSLGGSDGLRLTGSELQSAGDVRELASAAQGGVEYRVYQAVQLLDDEVI